MQRTFAINLYIVSGGADDLNWVLCVGSFFSRLSMLNMFNAQSTSSAFNLSSKCLLTVNRILRENTRIVLIVTLCSLARSYVSNQTLTS